MRVWETDEVEHDVLAPDRKSLLKKPSKPQFESPTSESLNSLKRLIGLNGISIKGETLEKSYGSHIITMNERKAQTFIQKSPEHIKNIAKHSLIRIYPSIVRVTSSNLDPFQHWFLGVQMVALNFQTFDRAMELNQALFSMNGGCGYVRKPTNELRQTHLSITIISAQIQISKSSSHSSNTFTEIEIIGHTLDAAKHRIKPKSTLANRIIWGETVGFDLMYPSLDFIRVLVADNENRSNFCALIDSLEQGYRHIPLKKDGSLVPFSSLFVKIEFS
jgi:phosphatidylinositol phospholipase C delta